ncbi:TolB family protein [Winogradskyella vincentii]|uniref:DPP IV N-terminal domain-containing protein n=1 Tax=Winogradskyella vincentii TaxID=2877122 RepID=A0ABS7Y4L4_9FLAO|nr:DPP IV N-terminal domain-containing protein [Winogradskyella vincentii]MCA0154536.1 DPP IV N-terminal domain-containing protein [Winogradskyella vincentii]
MNTFKFLIFLLIFSSCKEGKKEVLNNETASSKQEIAFVTDRDGNSEIYTMDINGENLRNITKNDSLDFSPSWSSDGQSLYFYSKRDGNAEIYTINSDGTELTRLTNHPRTDVLPEQSPDGEIIVFMSDRDSLSRNIYLMNKDGSNIRQLTKNKYYEESPSWSNDGQKILFTRQLRDSTDTSHAANGEIHITDVNGENVTRLTNKIGYDSGAKFSPNGKKIAFYGMNDKYWDLFIINSDGTSLQNLTNDSIECYSPDWSSDGQWLVYTAGSKGNYNIWKININTKKRIKLTNTNGRNESAVWKK